MSDSGVVASESEQIPRLPNCRCPLLDIVLVSRVTHVAERLSGAMDLFPDHLCQLQNRRAYRGGKVEVLVQGSRVLDTNPNSPRQIATIGVVTYLLPVAQDVQRILSLHHFLHQVGNHVGHGQAYIAAHDVAIRQRPLFSDADTIEGPHDGVRKLVLFEGALNEIFDGEFLEAIG